jgi:hypothetical protein
MAQLTCELCGKKENFSFDEDLWTCSKCKMEQPTGLEKSIRSRVEGYRKVKIPTLTVGRAIGFAAGIYELSTHNQKIDVFGIENRLRKKTGIDTGFQHSSIRKWEKRQNEFMGVTLTDEGVGMLIYVLSGTMEGRDWNTAYIVFRGSRGAKQGSENPNGAGWGKVGDGEHNLDWGTNFNTAQVPAPWAPHCKIHQGFLQMYTSVRGLIHEEVQKLTASGLRNLEFVCTGHSLGAGLATICAHDLECSMPIRPFCYPFCSPKTGNLKFVRNFDLNLASKLVSLACEPGAGLYSRGITFVQGNDPVSWGGQHGFAVSKQSYKNAFVKSSGPNGGFTSGGNSFMSGYQHLRSEGQRLADTGSTVKQLLGTLPMRKSATQIYYLAPNVYRVSITGLHAYTRMEEELLGKRG